MKMENARRQTLHLGQLLSMMAVLLMAGLFINACGGGEEAFFEDDGEYTCQANQFAEEDTGSVSGTVKDKNGNGLEDCIIELWSCCACVYRTTSDAEGAFSFDEVGDGDYTTKTFCPDNKTVFDKFVSVKAGENTTLDLESAN